MRVRIAISFELPEGVTREDALVYAVDAVKSWRGSFRPAGSYGDTDEGDPMFYLDSDSVRGTIATTSGNKRKLVHCE